MCATYPVVDLWTLRWRTGASIAWFLRLLLSSWVPRTLARLPKPKMSLFHVLRPMHSGTVAVVIRTEASGTSGHNPDQGKRGRRHGKARMASTSDGEAVDEEEEDGVGNSRPRHRQTVSVFPTPLAIGARSQVAWSRGGRRPRIFVCISCPRLMTVAEMEMRARARVCVCV